MYSQSFKYALGSTQATTTRNTILLQQERGFLHKTKKSLHPQTQMTGPTSSVPPVRTVVALDAAARGAAREKKRQTTTTTMSRPSSSHQLAQAASMAALKQKESRRHYSKSTNNNNNNSSRQRRSNVRTSPKRTTSSSTKEEEIARASEALLAFTSERAPLVISKTTLIQRSVKSSNDLHGESLLRPRRSRRTSAGDHYSMKNNNNNGAWIRYSHNQNPV